MASTQPPPQFHVMQYIISSIDSPEIDIEPIRGRLASGLDECPPDDRCLSWLIVLGVYSSSPADWPRKLHQLKQEYNGYINDLKVADWHTKDIPTVIPYDADLGLANKATMLLIHEDIIRTSRSIFCLPPLSVSPPEGEQNDDIYFLYSFHFRKMERILYTFAMLNPFIGYMQGFNELIQPMYYVLVQALELFNFDYHTIEVLCFNMFLKLMMNTNLVSFFRTSSNAGTLAQLSVFTALLNKYQPDAASVIEKLNIHTAFYGFRWFALLYSQEFPLPDVIWIWDAILSHFDKVTDYAFYIGLGIIDQMKNRIMKSDFASCIAMFQNLNAQDVKKSIIYANKLWKNYKSDKKRLFIQ
ncbi:TBC domain protein, putative [Trichomonas vaginalis G3]|uniref:TBC domain protein, putative n=1 Tax=Trichomonas vaginalis (strain ATCC PRA-98 / G3) TaxID=412133 RepID=A2DIS3_TRIV3|nr:regulation of vesicle fusion [Trichomonas vaginalis G3]EAY19686.1 TBC domain protein, putative [Trichomonas vaginalis G3]KAI5521294.1 regulation of vesicle fusion [Trichomonas vaginalis G3]|eukprot:XP_001580672.1 TBC domain protein [Trichomonas vaginalis G3]